MIILLCQQTVDNRRLKQRLIDIIYLFFYLVLGFLPLLPFVLMYWKLQIDSSKSGQWSSCKHCGLPLSHCDIVNSVDVIRQLWRSKALRGPWFNSNLGPSLSLPSTSSPSPSPLLSLLFPSPAPPSAAKRSPKSSKGAWGAL